MSPVLAPIDKRAALILHRISFGWILANGSVDSGTRMTTLADLNSLIILFEGGFAGMGCGSDKGRVDFTVFAQDSVGFGGSGWCS